MISVKMLNEKMCLWSCDSTFQLCRHTQNNIIDSVKYLLENQLNDQNGMDI